VQEHSVNETGEDGSPAAAKADPVAILLAQHQAAEAQFASLAAARAGRSSNPARELGAAPETTEALLAYLDGELEAHIRLEEDVLFPQLRRIAAPWDAALIDQMIAGHDQIRAKRQELRAALAATTGGVTIGHGWWAVGQAVVAVHHTVSEHLQNEEELVFRLVPELLTTETSATVSRQLTKAINTMKEADMSESSNQQTPLRGTTTGSSERPAQRLAAPLLAFDLPAEIARLQQESAWVEGERNGKTLVKEPDFRIVLTAMKSGTRLAEHEADARISIQVLSGQLAVSVQNATTELAEGHLLALERNIPHDVVALKDSAFLLTLAWPERPEDALPQSNH
jgi:quercetin dioxygenase-like cupin family protein/iron-sulfur cluster repair protein YtfE (RIC family)